MSKRSYDIEALQNGDFCIDLNDEFDDVYIAAASFEERGTVMATYLSKDYRCKSCIVYYNEDNYNFKENLELLCDRMRQKSLSPVIQVIGSHRNSEKKNKAMISIAEHCRNYRGEEETNVVIDITGFTKIDLIVLLDFLTSYVDNIKIKLLYISPEEHGDWLSRGHSGICNIPGFCGGYDALKNTVLIILSGFEKERAQNLIDAYEPREVFLGLSNPAVQDKFGIKNADIQADLLNSPNVTKFDFSAREVAECYNTLCKVVESKVDKFNVVIAPLCTKLSAVACFKVAQKYPDVQLVYCFPQEYNYDSYSKGSHKLFVEYLNVTPD